MHDVSTGRLCRINSLSYTHTWNVESSSGKWTRAAVCSAVAMSLELAVCRRACRACAVCVSRCKASCAEVGRMNTPRMAFVFWASSHNCSTVFTVDAWSNDALWWCVNVIRASGVEHGTCRRSRSHSLGVMSHVVPSWSACSRLVCVIAPAHRCTRSPGSAMKKLQSVDIASVPIWPDVLNTVSVPNQNCVSGKGNDIHHNFAHREHSGLSKNFPMSVTNTSVHASMDSMWVQCSHIRSIVGHHAVGCMQACYCPPVAVFFALAPIGRPEKMERSPSLLAASVLVAMLDPSLVV